MRLIDADQLGIGKAKRSVFIEKAYADGWNSAIELINQAETVDAAPVVHGRWIEREDPMLDTYYTCSACGEAFYIEQTGDPVKDLFTYTYCPNCGAKMDLGG